MKSFQVIRYSQHLFILKPPENVEFLPEQVNFLIDKPASTGKGANATISYVHYHLEHHGLEEANAHFHTDNCAGQNKNNYFLWYFAWQTLLQLHHSVTYSFLIAGHRKFGPDRL